MRQYLDLYKEHKALIDTNGCEPLNHLRPFAAEMLEHIHVPRKGEENYANIDMADMLAPDYGIDLNAPDLSVDTAALGPLPAGVEVGSLREAARKDPEKIARLYGKLADMANPIVALDTLLVQDGLYLHVKRGVVMEKPIRLVNVIAAATPFMAVRRVLIDIEDESLCRLLVCDRSEEGEATLLSLDTIEIAVGKNAIFDYYHVEESENSARRLSAAYVAQEAGSRITIADMTFHNGKTRNEWHCRFRGEGAHLNLCGMGIQKESNDLAIYTRILHEVPDCKSDEIFKFIVDDKATGAFTGRILVSPGATKTEAYQANRNLVGSDEAKMYSRPQLEIYNDDVKCSHGCATGRLDPLQIFYMRTRGLTEADALRLLRQAFMADVIDRINAPGIRDHIRLLTAKVLNS